MGSVVRSNGYRVLHRPVELAGIIGNWPLAEILSWWGKCAAGKQLPVTAAAGEFADDGANEALGVAKEH
jgi:hypothetical protein